MQYDWINNNCINKIKYIEYENDTLFDEICDCTYVMLCCGDNPIREENVYKQILKLRPTKNVVIIYFMGYKKCLRSKDSTEDGFNNQMYIFQDALNKNYNRILFLEDDFFLEDKGILNTDIQKINNFISVNNIDVYGLGNFIIPTVVTLFKTHQKAYKNFMGMSHAIFYSKKYMINVLNYVILKINKEQGINNLKYGYMWDLLTCEIPDINVYRYYKPIIYQLFNNSDNQINCWKKYIGGFMSEIANRGIKTIKLDKKAQPGFNIMYKSPIIIYIIIIILIIIIIYYIWIIIKKIC